MPFVVNLTVQAFIVYLMLRIGQIAKAFLGLGDEAGERARANRKSHH